MDESLNLTKFEFLLTLEKNIIILREFTVKDYNPKSKNSMDLYYCVKNICEQIEQDLKKKNFDYEFENMYYLSDTDVVENKEEDKKEHFLIEIKLENDVFISRIFPAYVYNPQVRYSVDVRPMIKKMLSDLTDVLSSKKVNKSYGGKIL